MLSVLCGNPPKLPYTKNVNSSGRNINNLLYHFGNLGSEGWNDGANQIEGIALWESTLRANTFPAFLVLRVASGKSDLHLN